MKHEKEWYTCDRCGEEIKEDIHAWERGINSIFKRIPSYEYMKIRENMAYGYIKDLNEDLTEMPPIVAVEIITGYTRKDRTIHLCGKCRKEFEGFMRNGNNN